MVRQVVPADSRFLIKPNQSYDGNPLVGDEQVFPEDSAEPNLKGVSLEVAVDWLWREGTKRRMQAKMRVSSLTVVTFCLAACGSTTAGGGTDGDGAVSGADAGGEHSSSPQFGAGGAGSDHASPQCFPCQGYWTCGGDGTRIDLVPEPDGCLLSGLPGRNFLSTDGTITVDGAVVGIAQGSGARVHVAYPDGSQWLFCAGGGGPCP